MFVWVPLNATRKVEFHCFWMHLNKKKTSLQHDFRINLTGINRNICENNVEWRSATPIRRTAVIPAGGIRVSQIRLQEDAMDSLKEFATEI